MLNVSVSTACYFSMPNRLPVFISESQTTPRGVAGNNHHLFAHSLAFCVWAVQEGALLSLTQHRGRGRGTVDCLENPLSRWLARVARSLLHPPRRFVQEAAWVSSQHGIWVSRGRKQKLPVLLRVGPRVAECRCCLVLGPAQTHRVRSSMPATS